MTIRVVEETFAIKGVKVSVSALGLKNSLIILVTDHRNEYKIGSMALATPIADRIGETMPSVVTLLGTGGEALARVLARKVSASTGKISLSIVGLRETDNETAASIVKAVEKILEKNQERSNE
jgi:predicted ATP-grasp superfamily ATP-dependent carboligase